MNSADRQSLQFIMNKILFKIFGAMSKDTYSEVSKYFGIEPLEEVIGVQRFMQNLQLFCQYGSASHMLETCNKTVRGLHIKRIKSYRVQQVSPVSHWNPDIPPGHILPNMTIFLPLFYMV